MRNRDLCSFSRIAAEIGGRIPRAEIARRDLNSLNCPVADGFLRRSNGTLPRARSGHDVRQSACPRPRVAAPRTRVLLHGREDSPGRPHVVEEACPHAFCSRGYPVPSSAKGLGGIPKPGPRRRVTDVSTGRIRFGATSSGRDVPGSPGRGSWTKWDRFASPNIARRPQSGAVSVAPVLPYATCNLCEWLPGS